MFFHYYCSSFVPICMYYCFTLVYKCFNVVLCLYMSLLCFVFSNVSLFFCGVYQWTSVLCCLYKYVEQSPRHARVKCVSLQLLWESVSQGRLSVCAQVFSYCLCTHREHRAAFFRLPCVIRAGEHFFRWHILGIIKGNWLLIFHYKQCKCHLSGNPLSISTNVA